MITVLDLHRIQWHRKHLERRVTDYGIVDSRLNLPPSKNYNDAVARLHAFDAMPLDEAAKHVGGL